MGEWTLLRSHLSYKQNRGTKRSTRRCSFQWYHRRPSNSNRVTNARQCGADDGIFCLCSGVVLGIGRQVTDFVTQPFLATTHFLASKYIWRRTVEQETDLAGLNSRNFYSRHVEFLRAPHMNRNKNSGPKGLLRSLSCQRSGPSLPLFTQEPELNSQNLYSGTEMYLGPTWVLYKLVGNFAMTGLIRAAGLQEYLQQNKLYVHPSVEFEQN